MPTSGQADRLLKNARHGRAFRSDNGQACLTVPSSSGAQTVFPVRSAACRDWIISNFFNEAEAAPSPTALRAALRTLEAQARYGDFPVRRLNHRLAYDGNPLLPSRIAIDLANSSGEVLEITSHGWTVDQTLRYAFRDSNSALALPYPQPTENDQPAENASPLAPLRSLLKLEHPQNWSRVLAWLTAAFRPIGPYPVLVLSGPAGSGKTFLARALRSLIDPVGAPIHRLPARDHHLLQLAYRNWILAFDLVHRIPTRISEALCAISSGDALEITQPDMRDPVVFEVARPMILIAPHDETQHAWTPSRTLASRTLSVRLEHIARPRPESHVWSSFESLRPRALGALADSISTAIRRIRDVDLAIVPRFADCVYWTAAAAPALGLTEDDVIRAYSESASTWTGADPLREALYSILQPTSLWTGEAADLLNQLRAIAPHASLPATPKGLSQLLPSIAGIRVVRNKLSDGRRTLTLVRVYGASQIFAASDAPYPNSNP